MIKLTTLLCLGESRRKREEKAETHPRVWLSIPVLWSYTGKMESHWDYQKSCGRLDSTCEEHAHHIPTYLTRQHNTGSKTAMTKQKSQLLKAERGKSVLGQHLGGEAAAIVGTYSNSANNSPEHWLWPITSVHNPLYTQSPCRACLPALWFGSKTGQGWQEYSGYSDWPWGTKGTLTQGCIQTEWGEQLPAPAQATHQRYLKTLSTDNTSREPTWVPFASALLTLGLKFQGWDRNNTLKGNRAHSGLALRTTASATWDYSALPLGWWWPLRRGEVTLHTEIQQ